MREMNIESNWDALQCAGHTNVMEKMAGEDARFLSPQSKPQYTPHRTFVPNHIVISLHVDVKKKTASGFCETHLETFSTEPFMIFDAVDMKITKVEVNGKTVKHQYDQFLLSVPTPAGKKAVVKVHYSVSNPKLGIFFIHPTKDQPNKPYQAWTHSEAVDTRYWYPCQDWPENKASMDMHITTPEPFIVVANGELVKKTADKKMKGWNTYSWKFAHPNAPYLNSFAIGNFTVVKEKWNHVSVEYYGEQGKEDQLKRAFGKTPRMMEYMSNYLRFPYPYTKYAQVAAADFIFGGMEHTTCTTQTDWTLQDAIAQAETPNRPTVLSIHELAHQWFGDLVTIKDWSHLWIHEGFATYFEFAWEEYAESRDAFDYYKYISALEYYDDDKNHYRRPIVTNVYARPDDIVDPHTYEKGAQVIALLRDVLGDEGFRNSLAHFINKYAHQSVQTDHFINSIREATGKNMVKFFDQWIYGAGYPELKVNVHYDSKKKMTNVRVVQTARMDEKALWDFPVTIAITLPNGKEKLERVLINKREQRFSFPTTGCPLNVVFDHPNSVPKSLIMQKPREMWVHQLRHDSKAVQRIFAAQELSKTPNLEEINAILERVENDPFWGTRIECAATLRMTGLPEVAERLMKLYAKEKDHRVQRAMIDALSYYRQPHVYTFLKKATERTDSYIVPSEAYRGIGRWKNNQDIAFLKKGLSRNSWMDLIPTGIIAGLMNIQSEHALKELIALTSTKYNDRVRRMATSAIAMVGGKREEAMNTLVELTKDPFILIQTTATSGLGMVGDERVIPELEKLMEGHRDGRVKRCALDSIRLINGGMDLSPFKEEKKGKASD